jgi:Tfp pilus assembly protein PilF
VLKDTGALASLLLVTILLFAITHILFSLYSRHQLAVADNWTRRGVQALNANRPAEAVTSFRAALPYASDEHKVQLLLAEALAAAGKSDEATSYFRTLWESEPGSGVINLALARLAAQRGDMSEAGRDYHAAIDGTWEGDGSIRRPQVRLELVQLLIQKNRLDQARNELLIAAGNAPENPSLKLQIASLMEQAGDYGNALSQYRRLLQHGPAKLVLLEGAGRTAYERGNYELAHAYLERALNHPDFPDEPEEKREALRNQLRDAIHILLLYPSDHLSASQRAARTLKIEDIASERLASCMLLLSNQSQSVPADLSDLSKQWPELPRKQSATKLTQDGDLEEKILSLSYQVELATARSCGEPAGEDRLLTKIASAPQAVEVQ